LIPHVNTQVFLQNSAVKQEYSPAKQAMSKGIGHTANVFLPSAITVELRPYISKLLTVTEVNFRLTSVLCNSAKAMQSQCRGKIKG